MGYYLAVTGEGIGKSAADGMTIVRALIDRRLWTFPDVPSVRALQPGDRFAIYVTKGGGVAGFVGVATVGSQATALPSDGKALLRELGLEPMGFKLMVRLSAAMIWSQPKPLQSLVPKLAFMKNKNAPGWYLRSPFQRLDPEDFRVIADN